MLDDLEKGTSKGTDVTAASQEMRLSELDDTRNDDQASGKSPVTSHTTPPMYERSTLFCSLIVLLGTFASSLFLGLGLSWAAREQRRELESHGIKFSNELEASWADYLVECLWVHEACHSRKKTRLEFRELFEYLKSGGLDFLSVSFVPNITRAEREAYETGSREFYESENNFTEYLGITQVDLLSSTIMDNVPVSRVPDSEDRPFYFPVHLSEPLSVGDFAGDYDLYSAPITRAPVYQALETWQPVLTSRLPMTTVALDHEAVKGSLYQPYGVAVLHPGTPLSTRDDNYKPRDLAQMFIAVDSIIDRSLKDDQREKIDVYLFDIPGATTGGILNEDDDSFSFNNHSFVNDGNPMFLGSSAGRREVLQNKADPAMDNLLNDNKITFSKIVDVAGRQWQVVCVPITIGLLHHDSNLIFIVFGGAMILVACVSLALFVYASMRRVAYTNKIKAQSEAEKASLLLDSANASAKTEREMNDFIAHEVRNPLSAAMAALTFVSARIDKTDSRTATSPGCYEQASVVEEEDRGMVREDVKIIGESLNFIDQLLRSMLDMHRAASNQMRIVTAPTDVAKDIFEPAASMLQRRGGNYQVEIICDPPNLIIDADKLRLTQVILNLGRNSTKFVEKGFIRLRAGIVENGKVQLSVEDSGPGIPESKRDVLFSKFQESLDSLNQGTGIGLSLCKNLVTLMEGNLWLDASYHSGVEGCPGTRFVVDLSAVSMELEKSLRRIESSTTGSSSVPSERATWDHGGEVRLAVKLDECSEKLPESYRVLFVDDDVILRRLFSRGVKRVAPNWTIQEAASGEAAFALIENEDFDLIFMDQYMASVEKQLLGTETVAVLRNKGVNAIICGLSANDVEESFVNAGADFFRLKPMSSKADALHSDLCAMINGERRWRPIGSSSRHLHVPRCKETAFEILPDSARETQIP